MAKWCIQIKKETGKIEKRREKGKWKKGEEETGFSKDAMAKIGGKGRRQELSGNCISQGSLENSILLLCSDPYDVTFLTNKRAFATLML